MNAIRKMLSAGLVCYLMNNNTSKVFQNKFEGSRERPRKMRVKLTKTRAQLNIFKVGVGIMMIE